MAAVALLVACGLAAWGWWQPGHDAAPDEGATVLWRSLAVVVITLHLAAASTLLGGAIYLAFGRLLGSRACSACGWQAMIIERIPEAAVAAAITAVGVAVFQGSAATVDRAWATGIVRILPWGFVWWLLVFNRSVVMVRQPAVLRTALVWCVLLALLWIGWRSCLEVVAGDTAAAGWLAGSACGVGLTVLAAALHRQALLLGLRFDRPAALAEIVGGLSPLRRLAACALGGLGLAAACGLMLALRFREALSGAEARLVVVAVASLWLLVTWGAALVRDRLGPACSPSISAATISWGVGLSSVWVWLAGKDSLGVSAAGLPAFLGSLGLTALGIAWCVVIVRRKKATGGCAT